MTKRISGLRDLGRYGIEVLTGEACGLGLRILCDVSDAGRRLIAKAWALPPDVKFEPPWNSRVNGQPSVGSILLGPYDYMTIGIFALLGAGCRAVYRFVPRRDVFESNRKLVNALREQRMLLPKDDDDGQIASLQLVQNVWVECVKKLSDDALECVPYGSMFSENTLMGVEEGDAEYLDRYLAHAKSDGWDWYTHREHGTAGDRNQHQFSGRIT